MAYLDDWPCVWIICIYLRYLGVMQYCVCNKQINKKEEISFDDLKDRSVITLENSKRPLLHEVNNWWGCKPLNSTWDHTSRPFSSPSQSRLVRADQSSWGKGSHWKIGKVETLKPLAWPKIGLGLKRLPTSAVFFYFYFLIFWWWTTWYSWRVRDDPPDQIRLLF